MTESILRTALRDSVAEVLEKMFFVEPVEQAGRQAADLTPADEIAVRVRFNGHPSGWLLLGVTPPAARQIAADFLGLEEAETTVEQTMDVIRELANMFCGSLLSRVESSTVFELAGPEVIPPGEMGPMPANARIAVDLDNGRLVVSLNLESERCPRPVLSAF